jgi:hypothetical protein
MSGSNLSSSDKLKVDNTDSLEYRPVGLRKVRKQFAEFLTLHKRGYLSKGVQCFLDAVHLHK